MVVLKVLVLWCVIVVLAVLNGALRDLLLVPALGSTPAYLISGLLLCTLIFLVALVALPWLGRHTSRQRLVIGMGWLFLTLVFEFSLGLFQGKSWPEMLAAYRFHDGNLWPLVLLVTALAPWAMGRLRGR